MVIPTTYLQMQNIQETNFGTLGRVAKQKLNNDNDIKIIIQGKNSQTGIGKTTLAIQLCRFIDSDEWHAEEKAYIDIQKYLNDYLEIPGKSALLLDEIGTQADSRRSMSNENVQLSQGWQMLRAFNHATVATLPSTSTLDKRMLELADYWVLVKRRGIAQPYEIKVNDFSGTVARKPLPGDEHIQFADLPDDDPDKKYLDQIKDNQIRNGSMETIKIAEHKQKIEKAEQEARKKKRNELIRAIYHETDLSYEAIGEISGIDLTKQTVGQIVRRD